MVSASAQSFVPPAIPWREPRGLAALPDLGPGLDPEACALALARLCADPDVRAVLVFGSRARGEARPDSDLDLAVIVDCPQLPPAEKASCWQRLRAALGPLGVRVDLVLAGADDAERLSGSRWHVFGDVAREGKLVYVAS